MMMIMMAMATIFTMMIMIHCTSPSLAKLFVLPVVPLAALPAKQPGRT